MVGVVMMVSGVIKGIGLLRIGIFLGIAAFGFHIYDAVTFTIQFVAIDCTVVKISK